MNTSANKLYIPRCTRKLRQKLFLSNAHKGYLEAASDHYASLLGREVSNSILIQRAVELLVARSMETLIDPTARDAEVAAIGAMVGKDKVSAHA